MPGKIIFLMTNHGDLGTTGNKTGWYLPEVAHPYEVLTKAKFDIIFVSPKGGASPMDEGSAQMFGEDPVCKAFLKNDKVLQKIKTTSRPEDVKDLSDVKALFYPGGHGPMFDLPSENHADLAQKIYAKGGVLAAVCHGTVGFTSIKLPSGKWLVDGQKVTGFTNDEEDAVKLSEQMPFMLETKLKEQGADFVNAGNWQENVQVSGRLVTGQNPASATKTAEAMVKLLK